ncbi:MAG: DMT family transporter, partial [Sneathiella sp.]|nr:DMT family transporter [Sneathiella sp.]
SLHHTSVANTLVLIATAPLFAALLGAVILKEKLPLATWLAIAVSLIGITYIFSESLSGDNLMGDIFALCAALSLAGQITTVRRSKNVDMVPSLIVSGICIGLIGVFAGGSLAMQSGPNLYYLLLLGLFVLPISFGLITVGPRYIPAAEVSLLMLLETFLGPIWAWLVLAERPANETLAGGALVITTLVVHTLYTARRERAAA